MRVSPPRRPITIVVPVYGDLESLERCIESLRANVDTSVDSVLLVDDHGPDTDAVCAAVSARIAGLAGFRLERNPTNLGFVGTCNRAAFELDRTGNDLLLLNSDAEPTSGFLDELAAVLSASPKHGAVCPRSDNATIASLPFRLRDPAGSRDRARTRRVFEALAGDLPRFSVSPVSMGFCILIRRELVDRFGLFDEAFAPGYGEENDFCLRIAREGYLSLIANRALVLHDGARSFTGVRRDVLRARHEAIVSRRYPGFRDAVARYLWAESDVADLFADVLVPSEARPLILAIRGSRDGTVLRAAIAKLAARPDVEVTVRKSGSRALKTVATVFDLVVAPADSPDADLRVADRSAPRWMIVGEPGPRTHFADVVVPADAFSTRERAGAVVRELLATGIDLDRLRQRHRAFATGSDLALPETTRLRALRQWAIQRMPTVTVVAEWAILGTWRRLRGRGRRTVA